MIVVTDLVKKHGKATILNGVSLRVERGEVAAVVGPSGGGKSTLLRCINALEPFEAGSISVEDLRLEAEGPAKPAKQLLLELRRKIGMVFQQFNLFPHMTALQNVMCGPRYVLGHSYTQAECNARELLKRVGLQDKGASRPDQLSGGQQQRVAIARALAVKPSAILFDEPTSALDPRMADEVLGVINDLAKSGQTMIVVTHAMRFARQVANQVHVMSAGQIVESGPPETVFNEPRHDVTREFLSRTN
ncbi:MAG: amino acid ABC transporter ATP-binding protein [Planctomycetes bacterium]|nr:amino acid ABC transporter ATP-binding protein [Planctomycetota bacterium]